MGHFLKLCQQRLNHSLGLGAYLLKPVQRVLKYSLLLQDLAKHMVASDDGYTEMTMALNQMTFVAEHINTMKKKYDDIVHVHEVQALLSGWEEGHDLTKYGNIVLEDSFKVLSSKTNTSRITSSSFRSANKFHVFLFEKLILLVKKKEDGYQYKDHVKVNDVQLTEQLSKEPTCFQIRQISSKSTLTFQARTVEQRKLWNSNIKRLLMESMPHLPDKAIKLIMTGFTTDIPTMQSQKCMTLDRIPNRNSDNQLKESPLKNSHRQLSYEKKHTKPPLQLNSSIPFIPNFGFSKRDQVPSPSPLKKKNKKAFELPSPELNDETNKRELLNDVVSSPAGSEVSWNRSDSDPSLNHIKITNSLKSSMSLHSSPLPHYAPNATNNNGDLDESSVRTTPTPTNLDLPSSIRSSISSPDFQQMKHLGPSVENIHIEPVNDNNINADLIISPLSTDCPSTVDEEDLETSTEEVPPIVHIRSKSAPTHEPNSETLKSKENTPKGSIASTSDSPPHAESPGLDDDDDEDDIDKESLIIVQSPTTDCDTIHLDYMENHHDNNEVLLIQPPEMFSEAAKYTIDTANLNFEQSESEKHEILFEQLMNSSSADLRQIDNDKEMREILSQTPEIDLTPSEEISVLITPPPNTGNKSFRHSSTATDSDHDEMLGSEMISPSSDRRFSSYERQTTPYTSIEDLPSCEELPAISQHLLSPTSTSTADSILSDSSSTQVKRWHSFQGHNRIKKTELAPEQCPPSPSKADKVMHKAESASKTGFLRNRSFSRAHAVARPISLVGLVHTTRDDSDLVNLEDAIELAKRTIKLQTDENVDIETSEPTVPDLTVSKASSDDTSTSATVTSASEYSPSPTAKKRNRWSLLRSKPSGRNSKQPGLEPSGDLEKSHKRISSEPYEDKGGGSLFSIETADRRRRGITGKDKKRIFSTNLDDEHGGSPSPTPNSKNKKQSRVQLLAREYSKRIKSNQNTFTESLGPEGLTSNSTSQVSLTSQDGASNETAPKWLKSLKKSRKQRSNTLGKLQDVQKFLRQQQRETSVESDRPTSPLSITSDHQSMSQPASPPLSPPQTPLAFEQSLTSSQSYTTGLMDTITLEVPTTPSYVSSQHSHIQRFSSESTLTNGGNQNEPLNSKNDNSKTNHRQRKGWVKSLVSKFSSNK
jgi:hypothetical protein